MYESATFKYVFQPYSVNYMEFLLNDFPEDTIANKIRKLRFSTGLSQINFGKLINRKEITIAQWEREIFKPSKLSQQTIIDIFNLPYTYFD